MAKLTPKIEKGSLIWIYLIAALPLIVAALAQFGVVVLTNQLPSLLSIFVGLFILTEVGFRFKGGLKKKGIIRIVGLIVAAVIIIGALMDLVGLPIAQLSSIQGFISVLAIVYIIWAAFT